MFKLLKKLIAFLLIAGIIFIAIALWRGGEPFRWFGTKTEKASEIIKEKSEEIGEEADKIKEKTEDIKRTTKEVTGKLKKTEKTINNMTGSKKEQ